MQNEVQPSIEVPTSSAAIHDASEPRRQRSSGYSRIRSDTPTSTGQEWSAIRSPRLR